ILLLHSHESATRDTSTPSLHDALPISSHPEITRELVTLFELRFDPEERPAEGEVEACIERIHRLLDDVASLNDDQLLRRYMELRSEEHTSELQSRENLVCRLLLEKKNT